MRGAASTPPLDRPSELCKLISPLMVVADPDRHVAANANDRRARLNQRLRQSFIEGAEVDSRRRLGRGLTAEELERVLGHYPGDVGESREP
jgi:hypothetical protein